MRDQRSLVKARAKSDFLNVVERPDVVEKLKDGWLQLTAAGAKNRKAFIDFLRDHADELDEVVRDELLSWPEWQSVEKLA